MFTALAARFALTDGMKAFLGRFGAPLAIIIAIGLAVVLIDKRGYDRAKEQDRTAQLERAAIVAAIVGKIDQDLDKRLGAIAGDVHEKITTIDKERTVVQPIIQRELARDPRLADPSRCLSPGLLEAVNRARGYPAGALLDDALAGDPPSVPATGESR